MNRCDQEKRLTLFLLGDLSEQEEAEISRHLAGCATCQACAHELEPVLQALSDGLTKDNAKVPRFDLHHQLTLLSVPPESTHQVIDWMARSRPWLVAAASALVVVGLSYFLIFSAMYSRYYTLGTAAAGAAQTQPLTGPSGWLMRHVAPTAGRPYPNERATSVDITEVDAPIPALAAKDEGGEFFDGSSEFSGEMPAATPMPADDLTGHNADLSHLTVTRAPSHGYAIPNPKASFYKEDGDGLDDKAVVNGKAETGAESKDAWAGLAGSSGTAPDDLLVAGRLGSPSEAIELSEIVLDTGATVERELGRDYPKLDNKPHEIAKAAGVRVRQKPRLDAYATRTEEGRKKSLEEYNAYGSVVAASQPAVADKPRMRFGSTPTVVFPVSGGAASKPIPDVGVPIKHDATYNGVADTRTYARLPPFHTVGNAGGSVAKSGPEKESGVASVDINGLTTNALTVPSAPVPVAEPATPRPPRPRAQAFNPFVDTTENHFSTFAIDVSTASYNLTRHALRSGALPDPDVVRTEEILNAFDYGDAAPDRTTFRVYVEGAPSAFGTPGLTLLRIGVKGKRLGREEQRPAMLTFLIDTSGSMAQPDRIGRARIALRLLLDQLAPADKIQIISFDDKARLVLPPTPATQKKAILRAFDSLQCNGSTNLEDGMRRAYQQAAKAFVPGGENRVIMISDGVANLGADNAQDILREVEAFRKQGVTCSVFGVGEGTYNDVMLEELASKGQGVYRFLDSDDEVKRVFVDDLSATLNNIATDVKIQVEWSTEAVRRFRQLGYEHRALTAEQFRDNTVEAGEVGSGQAVTALYELDLASGVKQSSLGTVRVRYRRVDNGLTEEIAQEITPAMIAPALGATRPQFRLAMSAAAFAELLRGSPYVVREYADVAHLLRPVSQELSLDPRVKELLSLAEAAEGLSK